MYKSPIETMIADIQHQIAEQQDEEIYKAVVSVGINVDKDELLRALQYDRGSMKKAMLMQRQNWCGVRIASTLNAVINAIVYLVQYLATKVTCSLMKTISVPTEKGERENEICID